MVSDHLSDFVTRIRNGYMAGKKTVLVPNVKSLVKVAEVMVKSGYLGGIKKAEDGVLVELKYESKKPVVSGVQRVSRPGARIYSGVNDIPRVLGGIGMYILSTPKGVMNDKDAKKTKNGGELLLKIW